MVLLFVSLLTFGSYFAYDVIGAIAPRLVEELGAKRGTVGSFYTMYSIAAILSVFIGGILIDRLGTRKASMLFSILVFIGAVIVAAAKSRSARSKSVALSISGSVSASAPSIAT